MIVEIERILRIEVGPKRGLTVEIGVIIAEIIDLIVEIEEVVPLIEIMIGIVLQAEIGTVIVMKDRIIGIEIIPPTTVDTEHQVEIDIRDQIVEIGLDIRIGHVVIVMIAEMLDLRTGIIGEILVERDLANLKNLKMLNTQ